MIVTATEIEGLLEMEPTVFGDSRGYFFESFRLDRFRSEGVPLDFVRDNESMSKKGVLRGLHFQAPPFEQGKLVRVVKGSVLDVAVDIRQGSSTSRQTLRRGAERSQQKTVLDTARVCPRLFGARRRHDLSYKCTAYYNKESEGVIRWDDPALGIRWNISDPVLSKRIK